MAIAWGVSADVVNQWYAVAVAILTAFGVVWVPNTLTERQKAQVLYGTRRSGPR